MLQCLCEASRARQGHQGPAEVAGRVRPGRDRPHRGLLPGVRASGAVGRCLAGIAPCRRCQPVLSAPQPRGWALRARLRLWAALVAVPADRQECRSVDHAHCMEYLLSKGADPSSNNAAGDNALHVAARHANAACIQKMLAVPVVVRGLPAGCLAEVLAEDYVTKFIDLPNGAPCTRAA